MSSRSFSKNEVIFRQGDDAQEMFDIVSGSVGVYINYGQENETQLTVLKAGNFLGEMGLIENYPRSATAVAMEDGTKLQVIDDAEFSAYFKDQPERLLEIMRQISARIRERTEDYKAACQIRDEMIGTNPEKRSKTLLEKIKTQHPPLNSFRRPPGRENTRHGTAGDYTEQHRPGSCRGRHGHRLGRCHRSDQ